MNVRIFFGNLDAFRALRAQVFTAFQQHPKIANSCTGFVTFAAGDLLAQKLQPKDPCNYFNFSIGFLYVKFVFSSAIPKSG